MKKVLLLHLVLLLSTAAVFAQKKIYTSENVLKVADQVKFEYKNEVKKAASKDAAALNRLFDFGRIFDGSEAVEHGITCLELIPATTDEVYAKVVELLSPKMKAVQLKNITAAQGKTTKEDLKKPLSEWAPYTWEALNNRVVYIPAKDLPKEGEASARQPDLKTAQPPTAPDSSAPGAGSGTGNPSSTPSTAPGTAPAAVPAPTPATAPTSTAPPTTAPGKGN